MKDFLYDLFFAPGVILHELGHLVFCFLANVKVFRVKLFGFGSPAGFVEHAEPEKFFQSLLISFGPLTLNSLVSLVLFSLVVPPYFNPKYLLLVWVGLTGAMHAIPSTGDAHTLLLITNQKIRRNPAVLIGYPFVGFIYLLNFLKRFHLELVYAAVLFWIGNVYLKIK